MSLGFFDGIKDWASKKLASSEFVTYVEQATDEKLLAPNYDMFMVLVDAANDPKGEWVADVVRSVRIRLDSPNPKVKLFTIELVSVLVQNCGLKLHTEVAESKGLLNAIVETACLRQDLVRGPLAEARKAAIQLIVNMDVWFKHHPARDKVAPLASLIDEAKGRHCIFENVIPDTTTTIITDKFPRRGTAAETARSGQEIMSAGNLNRTSAAGGSGGNVSASNYPVDRAPPGSVQNMAQRRQQYMQQAAARPPVRDEVVIVEAIPVEEPDEERRAGMFEAVMLLGEMFHAAQAAKEPIQGNETIAGIAQQVREDFMFVAMLVNSGAVLQQADTLGSLYESQRTVLRELRDATEGRSPSTATPPQSLPMTKSPPPPPVNNNGNFGTKTIVTGLQNPVAPAPKPATKSAAPTLDELFALSTPLIPANSSNNNNNNRQQQPNLFSNPGSPGAGLPGDIPTSIMGGGGDGSSTARRSALPEPRQNLQHGQRPTLHEHAEMVEMDQELHSPKEGPDPKPPQANNGGGAARAGLPGVPPPRTAADTGDEGGDFDAFLNARLSIQNNQ